MPCTGLIYWCINIEVSAYVVAVADGKKNTLLRKCEKLSHISKNDIF